MGTSLLLVACGGAAGSAGRYLLSLLPFSGEFPAITLLTNLLGALLIGALMELSEQTTLLSPRALLLLKTGVCGGFTTFSTFSLETVTLLEKGRWALASGYALLSVGLCLAGVVLGKGLVRLSLSAL